MAHKVLTITASPHPHRGADGTTQRGWDITGNEGTFRAYLPECTREHDRRHPVKATEPCASGYHPDHVLRFLKRLATTYGRGVAVPTVPALTTPKKENTP